MDLRQFRYFVQIVESGSLAKASRQLSIVQPALSQQIAKLEEDIGRPLLVRSSRGVTPTPNGTALYHHAKFVLRQVDQAVVIARKEKSALSGCVKLGLAPTTNCQLGLPLMRHIRQCMPGVSINVIEGMSVHLQHMAQIGELDLAILFHPKAASEMEFEPLLEEDLFVILPADSPLVPPMKKSLSLEEIASLPLIVPSTDRGLRRCITAEFSHANVPLNAVAEIDSLPLLMRCLADGMGVTIKPMAAIHSWREPEYWRVLPIADAQMKRTSLLYSLPEKKLSPCASVVRDELYLLIRELIGSGSWQGARLLGPEPAFVQSPHLEADEVN
ncbi:LysR family transcriptional regulator [Candidimonas nitroreducens]|uniref:LysR family transcriptional regulator n=1 Tax=Candidimonas nitroreducens TaxID=683354 RepID=A0A225MUP7_9BURK|nr:LysR family transcriptional regulator [Candidimonas nitroreducens]